MKTLKKIMLLSVLCMFLIIPQTGCGAKEPVSNEFFCLDTVCTITIYGQSQKTADQLLEEAYETCVAYENLLSKTVEGSDIYKINNADGQPVEVSDETIEVIKKGLEFGALSDGKFDITIGAVSGLWDFSSEDPSVPDDSDIQDALKTVDYTQVKISGNKVSLKKEGAQLDLGGIAKGYIADRITEQLAEGGVDKAIINLGGNIVAMGEKEDGAAWTIGIERPYSDRTEIIGAVQVEDETVTTSGVYERCFESDGKLYHHVLDPETGYPAEVRAEAVTVEGPSGMSAESDALGTVFLMLGSEGSEKILEKYPEFKIAFVDADDNITVLNGMEIQPVE